MRRLLPFALLALSGCLHVSQDPWIAQDKAMHFAAGAVITLGAGPEVGCAAGIGKELYDATGRGTPSWRDAVVTCTGAAVTAAILSLVRATQTTSTSGESP